MTDEAIIQRIQDWYSQISRGKNGKKQKEKSKTLFSK